MELQNEYIVVIYRDTYNYDVNISGFSLTSSHSWEEYLVYLNMNEKQLFPFTWNIGKTFVKVFSTFKDFESKFEVVTISSTYRDILKTLLGTEFGFFPYLEE